MSYFGRSEDNNSQFDDDQRLARRQGREGLPLDRSTQTLEALSDRQVDGIIAVCPLVAAVADRVHGPLVATYSRYDRAVGTLYPKASALARRDNQANPAVSRWGAMGSRGFQAVQPLSPYTVRPTDEDYGFAPAHFYSVECARVFADVGQSLFAGAHSDIRHPEIAWLIAAAAGSGEPPR